MSIIHRQKNHEIINNIEYYIKILNNLNLIDFHVA
jgi:hypothetical protein